MTKFSLKTNGFELICEGIKSSEFKSILDKVSTMDVSKSINNTSQPTKQVKFNDERTIFKKRLPNSDEEVKSIETEKIKEKPPSIKKSNQFQCPSCKQKALIEDKNIYLYYSYSDKKLFSIDKNQVNLQSFLDEKNNKVLIDNLELLINKVNKDNTLKDFIYEVNIVDDDSVFYDCCLCNTKSSLSQLINFKNVDYDQCVVCGSEIESIITNTGQAIKCSNKECDFDYTKFSIGAWREN